MKKIMSGNEAIARGVYEAGCKIAAAYPGTPSTEILENLSLYEGVYAEWSPNEKVALEVAYGASIAGARALAVMKHVGLNVAADPLFTMAYEGVNGGLVIVSADDPGMHSSQNEQDNRLYAGHAKIAMMEPSDGPECLDYIKHAFEISEKFDIPVLFRVTTRVCHSKGIVKPGEKTEIGVRDYKKNIQKHLMIPAHARERHLDLEKRLLSLREYSNHCSFNEIEWGPRDIGVIAGGVSYQYAKEVFGDRASYLKIGFTNPLPDQMIKKFANSIKKLYVIEENEPYIENYLRILGIDCIGKDALPICGELSPQIIREALFPGKRWQGYSFNAEVPSRPPMLCAGCPHRGILYEISKLKDITVTTDIGCYALGALPPLNVGDVSVCMGAGISAAIGFQKANDRYRKGQKVFGILGDSTFFHSGITGLLDAHYNQVPIAVVILDNRITAMTGHQQNPGTGRTLAGGESAAVKIEDLVKAIGVKDENIKIVDPYNLEETAKVVKKAYQAKELFVIIARRACALIKEVRKERAGLYCKVDNQKCRACGVCLKLGCPALVFKDGQVTIDDNACNGCGLCQQVCKFDAISRVGETN